MSMIGLMGEKNSQSGKLWASSLRSKKNRKMVFWKATRSLEKTLCYSTLPLPLYKTYRYLTERKI